MKPHYFMKTFVTLAWRSCPNMIRKAFPRFGNRIWTVWTATIRQVDTSPWQAIWSRSDCRGHNILLQILLMKIERKTFELLILLLDIDIHVQFTIEYLSSIYY